MSEVLYRIAVLCMGTYFTSCNLLYILQGIHWEEQCSGWMHIEYIALYVIYSWRKQCSLRYVCESVCNIFLLPSTTNLQFFHDRCSPCSLSVYLTVQSKGDWVCSLSYSNHLFSHKEKQANNKFKCGICAAPEFPRGTKHRSYSNMSNKVKKAERVRKCWRRCCLVKVGYNRELRLDKQGPLLACWSCWCMLYYIVALKSSCWADDYPTNSSNNSSHLSPSVFGQAGYAGYFHLQVKVWYFSNTIIYFIITMLWMVACSVVLVR